MDGTNAEFRVGKLRDDAAIAAYICPSPTEHLDNSSANPETTEGEQVHLWSHSQELTGTRSGSHRLL